MPTPPLTVPPSVLQTLAARTRTEQLHVAAFLDTAERLLTSHLTSDLNLCLEEGRCLPLTGAESPLCLLCALDAAADRYSVGFAPAAVRYFRTTGTLAKQAAIDLQEANPGSEIDPAQTCARLAAVLRGDL